MRNIITLILHTFFFGYLIAPANAEQASRESKAKTKALEQETRSTVSFERPVYHHSLVEVEVKGETRGSKATVSNSVVENLSATTVIEVIKNSSEPRDKKSKLTAKKQITQKQLSESEK